MVFGAPYYLFAALGIALPIAIHLWNRKTGKVIKVGSVQFLEESESSSFSNIKLTEILLLILRILLIIVLSLILAGAGYIATNPPKKQVLLIDKHVANEAKYGALLDSLQQHDLRWLSPSFPTYEGKQEQGSLDIWRLMSEMEARKNEHFTVYAANRIQDFKHRKRQLPENVTWISLPLEQATFLAGAQRSSRDSVLLIIGHSDANQTSFEWEHLSIQNLQSNVLKDQLRFNKVENSLEYNGGRISLVEKPTITCQLVYDAAHFEDLKYLEAALNAINSYGLCKVQLSRTKIEEYSESSADWIFWMNNRPIPYGSNVISFNRVRSNAEAINFEFRCNPRFTSMQKISALPYELSQLFIGDLYTQQIQNFDQRAIPNEYLKQVQAGKGKSLQQIASLNETLWAIFFALIIIERITSYIRKQ